MGSQDMMSINTVAARLGLSVHQLRRWELMFGLEIKRGRGQQRQYRPEDMTVLERIKELVEQGWPTSQIRPQIEAEGLITPKLIGVPQQPGNPEVILESIIGFRNFAERRFIELSKQIDELRQLVISVTLKQELAGEIDSPWQPVDKREEELPMAPAPMRPAQEINLGPEVNVTLAQPVLNKPAQAQLPSSSQDFVQIAQEEPANLGLGEVTDQNYLTILGRALDLIGWTDEEADDYSDRTFGISHWDELGRSQAEMLVAHLVSLLREQQGGSEEFAPEELEESAPPAPQPPVSEQTFYGTEPEEGPDEELVGAAAPAHDETSFLVPSPAEPPPPQEVIPVEVQEAGRHAAVFSLGQDIPSSAAAYPVPTPAAGATVPPPATTAFPEEEYDDEEYDEEFDEEEDEEEKPVPDTGNVSTQNDAGGSYDQQHFQPPDSNI